MLHLEHLNIIDTEKLFVIEAKGRTWKLKLQPEQKQDFYQLMTCINDNEWKPNQTQLFFYDFLKQNQLLYEKKEISVTNVECIYGPADLLKELAKQMIDFKLEGSYLRNKNQIEAGTHSLYLELQRDALYISNESFDCLASRPKERLFLEYAATVFLEKINKVSFDCETIIKICLNTFNNEVSYLQKQIDCHTFFESIAVDEAIGGICSIDNERFFPFTLASYSFQNDTYFALGNSEKDAVNNLLFHLTAIYPVTFCPLKPMNKERDLMKVVYSVYFKENVSIEETDNQFIFKTELNTISHNKTKQEVSDLMLGFTELLKGSGVFHDFRASATVN